MSICNPCIFNYIILLALRFSSWEHFSHKMLCNIQMAAPDRGSFNRAYIIKNSAQVAPFAPVDINLNSSRQFHLHLGKDDFLIMAPKVHIIRIPILKPSATDTYSNSPTNPSLSSMSLSSQSHHHSKHALWRMQCLRRPMSLDPAF